MFESIKALEIKISTVFNLVFAKKNISLFFFLNYLLILFNYCSYYGSFIVITKLATPTGIPTKEAKAEIETHPVTEQTKISKCSI